MVLLCSNETDPRNRCQLLYPSRHPRRDIAVRSPAGWLSASRGVLVYALTCHHVCRLSTDGGWCKCNAPVFASQAVTCLFWFRWKEPDRHRPFRVWLVVPIVFCATSLVRGLSLAGKLVCDACTHGVARARSPPLCDGIRSSTSASRCRLQVLVIAIIAQQPYESLVALVLIATAFPVYYGRIALRRRGYIGRRPG